jgi:TM2 domain-containing membrane protein YozV
MDTSKTDMYLMTNAKYFESNQVHPIRNRLLDMDESEWSRVQFLQFKDPTMMLIISLFAGSLGIDRFMIGDTGLGVGKLLTCGGFGIWAIVDLFLIMGATREKNMEKLAQALR